MVDTLSKAMLHIHNISSKTQNVTVLRFIKYTSLPWEIAQGNVMISEFLFLVETMVSSYAQKLKGQQTCYWTINNSSDTRRRKVLWSKFSSRIKTDILKWIYYNSLLRIKFHFTTSYFVLNYDKKKSFMNHSGWKVILCRA